MHLSAKAEGLIAELGRQQGVSNLGFDGNGLIPIRLDRRLEMAIGYSPANDTLSLIAVIDPAPDADALHAWELLSRNTSLVERRTRLALDPASGALILVRDGYVADLEFYEFSAAMDAFVHDVESVSNASGRGVPNSPAASPALELDMADLVIIRP